MSLSWRISLKKKLQRLVDTSHSKVGIWLRKVEVMIDKQTTTEDLKTTCHNYPASQEAANSALELETRIGKNEYSDRVYTLQGMEYWRG